MSGIAVMLVLGAVATTVAPGDLIGRVVPPYPDGLVSQQGSCVSNRPGHDHLCDYALGVLADGEGRPRYVIAEQSLGHRDGIPSWRVLDAMPYPQLEAGTFLAHGSCRIDGAPDGAIVAVVGHGGEVEWFDDVRRAWRLDFGSGRLVAIAVEGMTCANEGFGL